MKVLAVGDMSWIRKIWNRWRYAILDGLFFMAIEWLSGRTILTWQYWAILLLLVFLLLINFSRD